MSVNLQNPSMTENIPKMVRFFSRTLFDQTVTRPAHKRKACVMRYGIVVHSFLMVAILA